MESRSHGIEEFHNLGILCIDLHHDCDFIFSYISVLACQCRNRMALSPYINAYIYVHWCCALLFELAVMQSSHQRGKCHSPTYTYKQEAWIEHTTSGFALLNLYTWGQHVIINWSWLLYKLCKPGEMVYRVDIAQKCEWQCVKAVYRDRLCCDLQRE